MRMPKGRVPTHPGEVLLYEFMNPHLLMTAEVATQLGISVDHLHELIAGARGVTPELATKLAHAFRDIA